MMLLSQPTLPDQAKHVTLCKFLSRHGITVEDMNVECPEVWDSDLLMQFLPGRDVQLRAWAIAQEKEIPGMRYTLQSSGRGRCVQSFCECFPPYRGPLCDFEEGGFHVARNFSAVLHYLTSDMEEDLDELTHSLPRLWTQFNARFDYPVVIFHDGLSEKNRRRIVLSSKNRIWFAYVDGFLDVPGMLLEGPRKRQVLGEVKWSLGYRAMCRFRSGPLFLQPVLQKFDYAMTLATDALRTCVSEEKLDWNLLVFMTDIEIVKIGWFNSKPYQDYFEFLDSMGGFWLHRWGDHAVRTIAVSMFLPQERVYKMDIPYAHQEYCKCSGDMVCVREETLNAVPALWWRCI